MENENINTPAEEAVPVPVEPVQPTEPAEAPVNLPNPPLEGGQNASDAPISGVSAGEPEPAPPQPAEPTNPSINPPDPDRSNLAVAGGPLYQGGIIADLLRKANERIQFRKKTKLEKIMSLAQTKGKITNNDAQKLLRCSDATATRYLSELVRQGRLKMASKRGGALYQLP